MKWFLLILGLLALLVLAGWLMHRLSVSRSKAALQKEVEAEQERQDLLAEEKVRKARATEAMTREGDVAFRARQAAPIKHADRVTPAAMPKKVRRAQARDDADYVDFVAVEPTLADDLLGMRTPEDIWGSPEPELVPSWRELPDSLRETPSVPSTPFVQAPAESTDRWTPSFDTGRHEPVSAPDPTPASTTHHSSWSNDSGTTGGSSGGGHSTTSGGWGSSSGDSGSSNSGDSGGSDGGGGGGD